MGLIFTRPSQREKTDIHKLLDNYLSPFHGSEQCKHCRWPQDIEGYKHRETAFPKLSIYECFYLRHSQSNNNIETSFCLQVKKQVWQLCTYLGKITVCTDIQLPSNHSSLRTLRSAHTSCSDIFSPLSPTSSPAVNSAITSPVCCSFDGASRWKPTGMLSVHYSIHTLLLDWSECRVELTHWVG